MSKITKIYAREILDSRGNPTVEVEMTSESGAFARASVPSGASTGVLEAVELRDGDKSKYMGKGVTKAVANVNNEIAPKLVAAGIDVDDLHAIDKFLIELDGTKNKGRLGANAILGVSIASVKTAAFEKGMPIWKSLMAHTGKKEVHLPLPLFNVLNGGEHSSNNVDFQEYKIAPIGAKSFSEALQMGSETYHHLAKLLKKDGYATTLGDEGGFAPDFRPTGNSVGDGITDSNELPLAYIVKAIESAGYRAARSGEKAIAIYLDPATSSVDYTNGGEHSEAYGATEDGFRKYELKWSKPNASQEERTINTHELLDIWAKYIDKYPILSIEDPVSEYDWKGMKLANEKFGDKIQILGDDLFVTNPSIIKKAISENVANSSLIKLNQIGSVSETIEAVNMCHAAGWSSVFSHRSGETEDSFLADMTVAMDGRQLKTGAPARSERLSKYNQLIRIEEELKDNYATLDKVFFNVKNVLK